MTRIASRFALATILIVLVGCGGGRSKVPSGAEREPMNARAIDAFGENGVFYGAIVGEHSGTASFIFTQPLKAHPDLLMIIAFYSPAEGDNPIMQLRVGAPIIGTGLPGEVSPRVVCDLSADQANDVIANGIPDSLVNAMIAEVRKHPLKTQGPKGDQVLHIQPGEFFRIDPQKFFVLFEQPSS